ncbi:hypothetical protein BROUX41_004991 [Berkeleyomyces rouxiae]|uniref:uncharacterized protein n=1 Tax=Berkeleyomyces rouxiae TaxID=2035830 RepID=UPI003B75FE14
MDQSNSLETPAKPGESPGPCQVGHGLSTERRGGPSKPFRSVNRPLPSTNPTRPPFKKSLTTPRPKGHGRGHHSLTYRGITKAPSPVKTSLTASLSRAAPPGFPSRRDVLRSAARSENYFAIGRDYANIVSQMTRAQNDPVFRETWCQSMGDIMDSMPLSREDREANRADKERRREMVRSQKAEIAAHKIRKGLDEGLGKAGANDENTTSTPDLIAGSSDDEDDDMSVSLADISEVSEDSEINEADQAVYEEGFFDAFIDEEMELNDSARYYDNDGEEHDEECDDEYDEDDMHPEYADTNEMLHSPDILRRPAPENWGLAFLHDMSSPVCARTVAQNVAVHATPSPVRVVAQSPPRDPSPLFTSYAKVPLLAPIPRSGYSQKQANDLLAAHQASTAPQECLAAEFQAVPPRHVHAPHTINLPSLGVITGCPEQPALNDFQLAPIQQTSSTFDIALMHQAAQQVEQANVDDMAVKIPELSGESPSATSGLGGAIPWATIKALLESTVYGPNLPEIPDVYKNILSILFSEAITRSSSNNMPQNDNMQTQESQVEMCHAVRHARQHVTSMKCQCAIADKYLAIITHTMNEASDPAFDNASHAAPLTDEQKAAVAERKAAFELMDAWELELWALAEEAHMGNFCTVWMMGELHLAKIGAPSFDESQSGDPTISLASVVLKPNTRTDARIRCASKFQKLMRMIEELRARYGEDVVRHIKQLPLSPVPVQEREDERSGAGNAAPAPAPAPASSSAGQDDAGSDGHITPVLLNPMAVEAGAEPIYQPIETTRKLNEILRILRS